MGIAIRSGRTLPRKEGDSVGWSWAPAGYRALQPCVLFEASDSRMLGLGHADCRRRRCLDRAVSPEAVLVTTCCTTSKVRVGAMMGTTRVS